MKKNKVKFYFSSTNIELCYSLKHHLRDAKEEGLNEIYLYEALPGKIDGKFWCHAVDECCEEGCCGKECPEYKPKNGKNGMCRHRSNTFYHPEGRKIVFKVK